MSTPETTNGQTPMSPLFCAECGEPLGGGRFCPGCGHPSAQADRILHETPARQVARDTFVPAEAPTSSWDAHGPAAEPLTTVRADAPSPPSTPDGSGAAPGSRRWLPIAIAAGALVAVATVLAVLLLGRDSGSPSADSGYQRKLTAALSPVMRDNQQLSNELARLRGTKVTNAKATVAHARQTTTLAQGAAGALRPPAGSRQTSVAAAQLLDREAVYLSAVSAVLSSPASTTVSEVTTLQSNLTSAIIAAGPVAADGSQSVSGADKLTSWAAHAKRVLARRSRARGTANSGSSTSVPGSSSSSPTSGMSACDQNISAQSGTTTCAFASNVFWEYWRHSTNGVGTTFEVWKPSTSRLYAVSCSGTAPVTCATNTGALVTFPIGAVNAYTQSAADSFAASHDLGPDPYA